MSMVPVRKNRFRPAQRLRHSRQFDAVFRARRRHEAAYFIFNYCRNDRGFDRLGLAVSRKHGNAVRRNRTKRLIRELFRISQCGATPAVDIIVRPKAGLTKATFAELHESWNAAIAAIRQKLTGRNHA